MSNESKKLRDRLDTLGLSRAAIDAVWPAWWSDEAEGSPSAQAELRFGISRRLGIDPRSLLGADEEPRFLWGGEEARFKNISNESEIERTGISSFGRAVASIVLRATRSDASDIGGQTPQALREAILASGKPFVDLSSLLALCWGVGIPVIHLRVFPWPQKRMAAMTVRVGDRWAILLGRDSEYPAPIAFSLAHELGHIGLLHLSSDQTIIDFDPLAETLNSDDEEEDTADKFALELLTGRPELEVSEAETSAAASPSGLAAVALQEATALQIEPGTLALCFGYSTQKWETANGALKAVYANAAPVWQEVNGVARTQLELEDVPADAARFLSTVLGEWTR